MHKSRKINSKISYLSYTLRFNGNFDELFFVITLYLAAIASYSAEYDSYS